MGLHFDDAKLGSLADLLQRRLNVHRKLPHAYLDQLETGTFSDEIAALAQELTVPETCFFRHSEQYRALAEVALPDRMAAQSSARRLRILSAGCASGEEAYSLAIVAREAVDSSWDVSILGVDVNPAMLSKAASARYSAWSLRETPNHIQQRWFRPDGRELVLDDRLRAAVRFEVRNLAQDDPQLWQPGSYDIVFFRNVLMYFTPATAQSTIARIRRALAPGGYLFLGHAETLRGLSSEFHLRHTHGTFYYQLRDRPPCSVRSSAASAPPDLVPAMVDAVDSADSWLDAIRAATARIDSLTAPAAKAAPAAATPAWDLGRALELFRAERFSEALETMQRLPPESERDPDVLLLGAALQTHRGRLIEAETACRRLLDVDELSAGAHYLLALCREGAGDRTGAVHHDQVAIYLDPDFAMPHLHLGLLARRAGDLPAARPQFEQALGLLQREEGARLLLFGGGFSRDALTVLCRSELLACGGAP